ncbi:MAG: hypothetical protein ACERKY_05375 [Anaerolineales bacterium]
MTAIGGGVGFLLGLSVAESMSRVFGRPIFEAVLYGILGASIAVLQWLVLRAYVTQASQWVLASTVGWILVGALADVLEIKGGLVAVWPALIGATVGTFQWLVLQKHVPLAGFWIVASAIGWVAGWYVGSAMDEVVTMFVSSERLGLAILFVILASVVGAFTGLALIWLLRRSNLKKSALGKSAA